MNDQSKTFFNWSIFIISLILIYYGLLQLILINLITTLYLLIKTIKLVDHNKTRMDTYKKLIKQWVCLACYMIIDYFSFILPFYSIYNVSKLIIFLYAIYGDKCENIYNDWIKFYYKKNKNNIERLNNIIIKLYDYYKNIIINKLNYNNFKIYLVDNLTLLLKN